MAESETGLPTEPRPSYRQTRLHSSWENAWGSRWSPHLAMDVWKMPWDSTRCRPLRGFRSWKLLMYYITYIPRLQSCEAHTHVHTHTHSWYAKMPGRCDLMSSLWVFGCDICIYLYTCLFKGYKPISIYNVYVVYIIWIYVQIDRANTFKVVLQVPFTSHWCLILHVIFLLIAIFPSFSLRLYPEQWHVHQHIADLWCPERHWMLLCYPTSKSCWEFIWIRFPSFPKSFMNTV